MATGTQGTSGSAGTQGKSGQSGMGMSGAGQTGTDNVTYNLVSIVYHALQGAETYEQYIQDAEQGGNREMAQFFRQVQQENRQRAEQGFRLLAQCVGPMQQGGGSRSGQHVQSGSQSGQQGGAPSGQSGGQQSQSGGGSMQQGSSGTGSGRGSGSSGGNANR